MHTLVGWMIGIMINILFIGTIYLFKKKISPQKNNSIYILYIILGAIAYIYIYHTTLANCNITITSLCSELPSIIFISGLVLGIAGFILGLYRPVHYTYYKEGTSIIAGVSLFLIVIPLMLGIISDDVQYGESGGIPYQIMFLWLLCHTILIHQKSKNIINCFSFLMLCITIFFLQDISKYNSDIIGEPYIIFFGIYIIFIFISRYVVLGNIDNK